MFWLRPGYSDALLAVRAAVRRARPGTLPRTDAGEKQAAARSQVFARRRVQAAWTAMALGDALVQYGARVRAWSRRGDVVICDRYLADGLIDLRLRFPDLAPALDLVGRGVAAVVPTPSVSVLLTLPWDVAVARAEAKAEPFPDTADMRRARFEAYVELQADPSFLTLDATRTIEQVHERIWEAVAPRVG